jgi:hypothetical protein
MTQPVFVPISEADQVRPARHLNVPGPWTSSRPGDPRGPVRARGRSVGTPGPDAGFALRLARRFEGDLKLGQGEDEHDVLLGVALIGARRAASFGRAPSIYDVQFALNLWSFLTDVAPPAQDARRSAFAGVAHDYEAQRVLVDSISEDVLALTPQDAQGVAATT